MFRTWSAATTAGFIDHAGSFRLPAMTRESRWWLDLTEQLLGPDGLSDR
jgi:hypothetical protein